MLAVLCCALSVAGSVGAPKGYLEATKELSYRGQSRKRKDVPDAAGTEAHPSSSRSSRQVVGELHLANKVSAWQACHDRALRRLFQYMAHHADLELVGCLDAHGKGSCVLVMSPDADLAGDLETTKSTSGLWIEIQSADGKRCWPFAWPPKRQGT